MHKLRIFFSPYKYKFISKIEKDKVKVLEVGIGNDSPLICKRLYPDIIYDGLDKGVNYNLSDASLKLINKFYNIDLESQKLDAIEDYKYEYIVMAQVIEHLNNGEQVLNELTKKVKNGGYFYLETPREISKKFPSMKGTLNFYDDETHKRIYSGDLIEKIFLTNGFEIIRSGVKRDILRIIFIPFMIVKSLIKYKYIRGSAFWDLLGYSYYILAKKKILKEISK